jgi:hypothetical protein
VRSQTAPGVQHHRVFDAFPDSWLPDPGLDAVIDGTQTGTRVRFNFSEPPQQGARQRVDRLIGDGGFIPVANGETPSLRLLGLAPANFLDVRDSGAAHLETCCEVRGRGIRPSVTQLGDATLEHVVMAGLAVGHHGQTGFQLGVRRGVGPGLEKSPGAPSPLGNSLEECQIVEGRRIVQRHNTPFMEAHLGLCTRIPLTTVAQERQEPQVPRQAPIIRSLIGLCTTSEGWGMLQLPLDRWRLTSHCPAGGHAREHPPLTPWAALPHAARAAPVALRTDTSGRRSPRQSGLSRPLARPPEFGPESPGSSATWTPGAGNPSPTSDSRRQ